MIQITAGSFDGAITSDATKTGDDQDAYTYYDITGGSFSAPIEDSAYYNFAVAKGLTPGEYDASKETNKLEQREDGRYYIVPVQTVESGYVLMNIPYAEFYAAEGVADVDGVTSATRNKPRTIGLAGGSYHTDPEGTDISGVIYPVYVEDMALLAGFKQVTDEDSVDITVTNRGQTTTTTFTGKEALFENEDHAYYVLDAAPNAYKTLSIEDGKCSFSATTAAVETGTATVAANYSDHHADVVLGLTSDALSASGVTVSGAVLTAKNADGTEAKYALRHIQEIWRVSQLGWSWTGMDGNGLAGGTVTNVTYYLTDAEGNYKVLSFDLNETIKLHADITAAFDDANTVTVSGLPADIENRVAKVASKVGRGETPVVIAENAAVQDGKIVCTDAAVSGTTYTVTVTSDNYADLKAEATLAAALAITAQPQDASVSGTATASFQVTASGSGLTYQWQYRNPATGVWKNCTSKTAGFNTDTLTVAGVSNGVNRSGYQYRCIVTDANGNTVTSDPATLTVFGIKTQPADQNVVGTAKGTFKVSAIGSGLTYQWQYKKPGGSWKNCSSATAGYDQATLKVVGVSNGVNRDGYQYRCVITDANGNTLTSDPATLTVFAIKTQPKDMTAAKSSTAKFKVVATGSDLSYQWQYKTPSGAWKNCTAKTVGYNAATLKVPATAGRNGYQYRCVVTDANGNTLTTNAATLTVK